MAAFSRHEPRGCQWRLGNLQRPRFTKRPSVATTYRVLSSMMQLLLALMDTGCRTQFFPMPACSPGRHLHAMGPGDFKGPQNISSDSVSPNAVRCRDLPGDSVDDPVGFGPKTHRPPRAQFFTMPACSLGRHLNGIGSANFGGIRKISGDPVSPNAVRCRDLPGTSVDYPVAFAREGPRGL